PVSGMGRVTSAVATNTGSALVGALAPHRLGQSARCPMKNGENSEYDGPFAGRVKDLLKSPAFHVLSRNARRILDRIEIELIEHKGKDNGNLPVTYKDFVDFGVDRHAIAPASREIVALGLAKIKRGRAGNAEFRRPNLHGLTYRRITKDTPPTDVAANQDR